MMVIGCQPRSLKNSELIFLTEKVELDHVNGGAFYYYLPKADDGAVNLLVLVHGTTVSGETAVSTAHIYLNNWRDFADQHQFMLIVSAFDQTNYSESE